MKRRLFHLGAALLAAATAAFALTGAATLTGTEKKAAPLILLDAGHGGFDGGAVAADGTAEKDINLAVTLKLDAFLRAMGYDTLLIREGDVSVETEGHSVRERKRSDIRHRYEVMEAHPGCLYLCIHQNFHTGRSSGAQIFYTAQNEDAKALAQSLQTAIVGGLQPGNTRQIKPCTKDVYLIYHAKQTAVLIECGFFSDPGDLRDLKDESYQRKLAFAITQGLADYLDGRESP